MLLLAVAGAGVLASVRWPEVKQLAAATLDRLRPAHAENDGHDHAKEAAGDRDHEEAGEDHAGHDHAKHENGDEDEDEHDQKAPDHEHDEAATGRRAALPGGAGPCERQRAWAPWPGW